MQSKLKELIAVNRKASNRLLNVEDLSEAERHVLRQFFGRLVEKAKVHDSLSESHPVEKAEEIHEEKLEEEEHRRREKRAEKKPVERH